jgi:hypothetical protein
LLTYITHGELDLIKEFICSFIFEYGRNPNVIYMPRKLSTLFGIDVIEANYYGVGLIMKEESK